MLVGMDTTVAKFRTVSRKRRALLGGIIGQYVLPFIAICLLRPLQMNQEIAVGMLVIAAAPTGGISNVYTYLAGANTALSIVLTSLSCIAAAITMPLFLRILESTAGYQVINFHIPFQTLAMHLVVLLILPVLIGIYVRHKKASFVEQHHSRLQLAGSLSLFLLIAFVIYQSPDTFLHNIRDIAVASTAFVLLSMLAGFLIGWLLRLENEDRFALISELGVRNVAISTTVAISVLSRAEFAVFGTAYFLLEMPFLLAAVMIYRRIMRTGRPSVTEFSEMP